MGKIYKNRLKLLLMCLTTVILSIFILASLSGASEISENAIKMPIIMYHSVLKDKSSQNDYVISPDLFESDLKYFQENGYTTVTVNDLIDYVYSDKALPDKCVMLTFDDGYYNNYKYVFPLLKKYNAKAVISPVAKFSEDFTATGEENANYGHLLKKNIKEMNIVKNNYMGGGKNKGIILLKFIAAFLITYSHMGILFPKYGSLVTGGAIGDGLFFFCSGFTLFMGRQDDFPNWYKRRINRIYPTIIMWALVSAVIFNWNWQITDLITTPKYWFIPCIMAYYVIFYLIRTYLLKYLNQVFGIAFLLVAISSFWVLDFNHSVMYAAVPFMRIYYFLFMMLGAMVAIRKYKVVSPLKSGGYALVSLITYYVLMGIYKIDPFFCKFQLISLIPLLSSIYWIYRFCDTPQIYKILEYKSGGKFIYFISTLTLEIYMVQYAIFTDKLNNIFPLNIIIIYIIIFIAAYLLKCTAHLFSQIFSNEPFNNKSIYQV